MTEIQELPETDGKAERQGTPLPDAAVQGFKISVRYEHKRSDGNYGSYDASAWAEGTIPYDSNETDIANAQGRLFVACVASVLDALDVPYIMDDDGNIRPAEVPVVTFSQAERSVERALGGQEVPQEQSGVRVMNPEDQDGPLPDWLVRKVNADGVRAVYDNRKTRDPNSRQPHFKEAIARGGTGHGKQGAAKGYWPD